MSSRTGISHPFEALPPQGLVIIWPLLALTLLLFAALTVLNEPLKTAEAPWGMVSLQLAGTQAKASAVLRQWDPSASGYALLSLVGPDLLFLLVYSNSLALVCVWASAILPGRWRGVGSVLAWGQWIAGLLDVAENVALLTILLGSTSELWARLAQLCAIGKFVLVGLGILYPLLATGLWLTARR